MKCCYAAHCFLNLSQQEAAAAAVTSLSTSPSRPGRKKKPLTVISLCLRPTVETRGDYPPLFPRRTHQQIYYRPLCWSLWNGLNPALNCAFFSNPLPSVKMPPRPELTCRGRVCRLTERFNPYQPDWLRSGQNNGAGRKLLHMWLSTYVGM